MVCRVDIKAPQEEPAKQCKSLVVQETLSSINNIPLQTVVKVLGIHLKRSREVVMC